MKYIYTDGNVSIAYKNTPTEPAYLTRLEPWILAKLSWRFLFKVIWYKLQKGIYDG